MAPTIPIRMNLGRTNLANLGGTVDRNPRSQYTYIYIYISVDCSQYYIYDTVCIPGKRSVSFFKATVAGFRGQVDGNE